MDSRYDTLTKYIEILNEHPPVKTFTHEDVDEGYLMNTFYMRSEYVDSFSDEVMKFVEDHPELDLYHYMEIIDSYDSEVKMASDTTDPEYLNKLDAKGILAWIVSAVRAEQFKKGVLYDTIAGGIMTCWLTRLKEYDI